MSDQITTETKDEIQRLWLAAEEIDIATVDDKNAMVDFLKEVKRYRAKVVAEYEPAREAAHTAWKSILKMQKRWTDVLDALEAKGKSAILEFNRAEDERRRAEERRLQAEADEKARREREKLLKQADKLKTPELKQQRIEEAESITAPTVIMETATKAEGESTRKIWKARVVDIDAVPREWMVPNTEALNAFAKSTRGQVAVKGVEFYQDETLAISTK